MEVTNDLGMEADQDVRSLRSELSALKEDYVDFQDNIDALLHSASWKLTAQAAELTSCECQVDSPPQSSVCPAMQRLYKALRPCVCNQRSTPRRSRRGQLVRAARQAHALAEHLWQLDVAHTHVMVELGSLLGRHTAIEVREQNRALKRRARTSCARRWYALTWECRQCVPSARRGLHTLHPRKCLPQRLSLPCRAFCAAPLAHAPPPGTARRPNQREARAAGGTSRMRMSIHLCATFPDSCPSALEEKEDEAEKDREARVNSLLSTYVARSARDVTSRPVLRSTASNPRTPRFSSASPRSTSTRPPTRTQMSRSSWCHARAVRQSARIKAKLKQRDKRTLRLRQVFAGKTAEFHEALSAILGVKLAFYDNGQVRVTSQYDLGAAFVFQPALKDASGGGGARMQLVAQGGGGPQELPQPMRNWVEVEQSIPCFLASVTLGCYDKWKREQQIGGSVTE